MEIFIFFKLPYCDSTFQALYLEISFASLRKSVAGIYMTGKELRQHMLPKSAPLSEKLKMFKEVLLPRHPPVFHEWFLRTFPDPTSW